MRQRKFRAWNPKDNQYEYNFNISSDGDVFEPYESHSDWVLEEQVSFKNTNEYEQEFWEGDILSGFEGEVKGIIEWSDEDYAFILNGAGALLNDQYLSNFKVIGNIHQNPELCTT